MGAPACLLQCQCQGLATHARLALRAAELCHAGGWAWLLPAGNSLSSLLAAEARRRCMGAPGLKCQPLSGPCICSVLCPCWESHGPYVKGSSVECHHRHSSQGAGHPTLTHASSPGLYHIPLVSHKCAMPNTFTHDTDACLVLSTGSCLPCHRASCLEQSLHTGNHLLSSCQLLSALSILLVLTLHQGVTS